MKTATADSGGNHKRRRTAPANRPADINDLTEDILVSIAGFLPKTSRALLAVALTAPSSSWREHGWRGVPSSAIKAIISTSVASDLPSLDFIGGLWDEANNGDSYSRERRAVQCDEGGKVVPSFKDGIKPQLFEYYRDDQWSILDFVDIGNLAPRLSDDDIAAVLVCIDAPNNLRRLNLTNCFGLAGHGLAPLRHSIVLEKIDMGLYRQLEKLEMFDDALLSSEAALPIIDKILRTEGNSFARLQIPQIGLGKSNFNPVELQFYESHIFLVSHPTKCIYFGFRDDTGELLAHLKRGESTDIVDVCPGCGDNDDLEVCSNCTWIYCNKCFGVWSCVRCDKKQCQSCNEESKNPIIDCDRDECEEEYCTKCLVTACRDGTNTCSGCKDRAFDQLAAAYDAPRVENDAQREEIERLRGELEQARAEAAGRPTQND